MVEAMEWVVWVKIGCYRLRMDEVFDWIKEDIDWIIEIVGWIRRLWIARIGWMGIECRS